ncbi:MAG: RNA-binding cell elongation regulator Jag/EloR, partial [Bacillota bacterium]
EGDILSAFSAPADADVPQEEEALKQPKKKHHRKKAQQTQAEPAEKPVKAAPVVKESRKAEPKEPLKVVPVSDPNSAAGKAHHFLLNVTKLMNLDVAVESGTDEEGNVRVNIHGDTLGILIGRRGETLDALQYLASLNVNHGQDEYTRVTLDTENYRAKREEALKRLANRMANHAVKTGRKVVLEPMNPYERRILHSALQQNDAVTTHSEGDEPNRHVVISLK